MKINSSLKTISFLYDFNKNGGAVSTIGMGIYLPKNAQPCLIQLCPVTDLTSGGAAVVSVGVTNSNSMFNINAINYPAFNLSTWGNAGWGTIYGFCFVPNDFILNPSPEEITITIGVAPLTGGAFKGTILFTEY